MKEKLRESIEIRRKPQEVFAFLREIEPRLRLCPAYHLLSFTKLTEGPIQKGSRYKVKIKRKEAGSAEDLKSSIEIIEYESMVTAFIENELIETMDTGGKFKVRISLKPTEHGTILTHEEEFSIRGDTFTEDLTFPQTGDEGNLPLWKKILRSLVELETVRIDEHQIRIEKIRCELKSYLQEWLRRIKNKLEHQEDFSEQESGK